MMLCFVGSLINTHNDDDGHQRYDSRDYLLLYVSHNSGRCIGYQQCDAFPMNSLTDAGHNVFKVTSSSFRLVSNILYAFSTFDVTGDAGSIDRDAYHSFPQHSVSE